MRPTKSRSATSSQRNGAASRVAGHPNSTGQPVQRAVRPTCGGSLEVARGTLYIHRQMQMMVSGVYIEMVRSWRRAGVWLCSRPVVGAGATRITVTSRQHHRVQHAAASAKRSRHWTITPVEHSVHG